MQQGPATPKSTSRQLNSRAVQDVHFEGDFIELVTDYDQLQKKLAFEKAVHECKVCFMERMGTLCIQFQGCGHVFCK
jgi:E3 ubiquitin-protein ligase RNF14